MTPLVTQQQVSDAVEAMIRKSRISAVTTLVVALLLGGVFVFLGIQIRDKQADLAKLNGTIAGKQAQLTALQSQVDLAQKQRDQLAGEIPSLHRTWTRRFQRQLSSDAPFLGSAVESAILSGAAAQPAAGRVVYIQYTDPAAKPAMQALQQDLAEAGFVAPGIEHVDRSRLSARMDNVVRYFWQADDALAKSVAQTATASLAKACPKLQPIAAPAKASAYKNARPSLPLEIWIVNGC